MLANKAIFFPSIKIKMILAFMVGMQAGTTTMENSMEVP
jgi:hypothetical protein